MQTEVRPETVTLVCEEIPPAHDGTPRFQVGYTAENYTNAGWACSSPAEGWARLLNDELQAVESRTRALAKDVAVINALVLELSKEYGVELKAPDRPFKYGVSNAFNETRIKQVEDQRNEYQERLMAGHRCEHGRLCLDDCFGCPGWSVGGPTCALDDEHLWYDKANGHRREADARVSQ